MRKTFSISKSTFDRNSGLVKELVNYVVENLGPVYVEMEKNIEQVFRILLFIYFTDFYSLSLVFFLFFTHPKTGYFISFIFLFYVSEW